VSEKLWNKCYNGSLVTQEELTQLNKAGADIEWKGPQDATSLFAAAFQGYVRTVRLLLSAGANKEFSDASNGATPLFAAAKMGHIAVVKALLAAGAN
jgi:ankyrin repeat protein